MSDAEPGRAADPLRATASTVLSVRLLVAGAQACALAWIAASPDAPRVWPATDPAAFIPCLVVALLLPLLVQQAIGAWPLRALAAWTGVAGIALAALGWSEGARGTYGAVWQSALAPRFAFCTAVLVCAFVAHALMSATVIERRAVPSYRRLFDVAWKLGLQVVLAAAFVLLFFGILQLAAALFALLGIGLPSRLLQQAWFWVPALTLAAAASIHATDVQPAITRGARNLVLALFSWLLPITAGLVTLFLVALPFASLSTLWATHFATGMLLAAALILIFLINCAYQDGTSPPPRIKRVAVRLGAVALVPLVALAVCGLALRVRQHGWTTDRIEAAAVTLLVAGHALGYAAAAIRSRHWMRRLQGTNLALAWLLVALVLLLFTPVLDPARLMVASQMARADRGRLDFGALRLQGARWGYTALTKLAASGTAPEAAAARAALQNPQSYAVTLLRLAPDAGAAQLAAGIKVLPEGRAFPADLYRTLPKGVARGFLEMCVSGVACTARYVPAAQDGAEWLVVLSAFSGYVFRQTSPGHWQVLAEARPEAGCPAAAGRVAALLSSVAPSLQPHALPDVVAGNTTLVLLPVAPCQ